MTLKIGKYKVSKRDSVLDLHDTENNTPSTLTVGGGYDSSGVTISSAGVYQGNGAMTNDGAVTFESTLQVDGTSTLTGIATVTAVPVFSAGVIHNKVTSQSGTGVEDLTGVASDLIWVAATTQAGAITLPQATSGNAGMVIKVIAGADWATSAFKLGFANGGSTVMFGLLNVAANNAADAVETFPITNNAKALTIDADDLTGAGGAKGSQYTFTYISANLVHVEAHGKITTGTVAPDAGASVTAGI